MPQFLSGVSTSGALQIVFNGSNLIACEAYSVCFASSLQVCRFQSNPDTANITVSNLVGESNLTQGNVGSFSC